MKLKSLQNLPDLNFKQVPTIGTSTKNRISYYFWVLLFLPTLSKPPKILTKHFIYFI